MYTPGPTMLTLTDRLQAVQEKVKHLMGAHDTLRKKAADLDVEAQESRRRAEVLKARVAELERENEVLRTSAVTQRGDRQREAKQQIDELVNEIDQCLALLKA